jgi:NAD(P)-dependent dehydrogenase (short-subunit alcohol dehydrogenase family)
VKDFRGKVAAITGAGSGIGRALAVDLAGHGAHLALSDVDEAGLAATVSLCEGRSVKVTSQRVDVAERQAVHAWADQVVADHGHVNLIFNNAGVAVGAEVETMRYEDLDWLMGINFYGVVHGTKAFLPHLRAAGEGHVVNISSVFGLVAIPSQSAYNAAKFAVRGFTEALRLELDSNPDCGVSCTTVHPGGIKTNIANNARIDPNTTNGGDTTQAVARFNRSLMTSPTKAAGVILAGVQADQRRVLIGPDARLFDLLAHLPINVTQRIIRAGSQRMR